MLRRVVKAFNLIRLRFNKGTLEKYLSLTRSTSSKTSKVLRILLITTSDPFVAIPTTKHLRTGFRHLYPDGHNVRTVVLSVVNGSRKMAQEPL